jgi:hypothetical protein
MRQGAVVWRCGGANVNEHRLGFSNSIRNPEGAVAVWWCVEDKTTGIDVAWFGMAMQGRKGEGGGLPGTGIARGRGKGRGLPSSRSESNTADLTRPTHPLLQLLATRQHHIHLALLEIQGHGGVQTGRRGEETVGQGGQGGHGGHGGWMCGYGREWDVAAQRRQHEHGGRWTEACTLAGSAPIRDPEGWCRVCRVVPQHTHLCASHPSFIPPTERVHVCILGEGGFSFPQRVRQRRSRHMDKWK